MSRPPAAKYTTAYIYIYTERETDRQKDRAYICVCAIYVAFRVLKIKGHKIDAKK